MSEVPAGWVGPLIQQHTRATFHTVATAPCHRATAVVVATLLPREGSGVSCSLLGRTAGNRIFLVLSQEKATLCFAWLFTTGGTAGTEV